MRDSTLVILALLLGAILAGVVYLGLDRQGYLGQQEAPDWEFRNRLLEVPYGTRVIFRSANPDAGRERLWFGPKITDPEVSGLAPGPQGMPSIPHVRMGRETQVDEERTWYWVGSTHALFSQLGARTTSEWLMEIRPVREALPDGTHKIMLRAAYGNQNGSRTLYFYDPGDKDAASRGFGWVRMEAYAKDQGEITFSYPAGRFAPK